VGKSLLLLCVGLFVVACLGCEAATPLVRSATVNSEVAVCESVRALGLDRPSMLHMRDNVPVNYYSPYR
jgi:hypothetical protein